MKTFKVGDRVKPSREFLRICRKRGDNAARTTRGTITSIGLYISVLWDDFQRDLCHHSPWHLTKIREPKP